MAEEVFCIVAESGGDARKSLPTFFLQQTSTCMTFEKILQRQRRAVLVNTLINLVKR